MSSRRLHIVIAATALGLVSILFLPGATTPVSASDSIADLLLADDIQKAEALLQSAPQSAENIAFQGEIEFRKGHFDRAETLYRAALQKNEKTARAHFGLGKLAMAKLKAKDAVQSFKRAIDLDSKEPLYRFYASDAADLDKNDAEKRKQLEEYVRLMPQDGDRVTEAKAGLEILNAFKGSEMGAIDAPDQPAPIPFTKTLNLLFAEVMVNGQGPFRFVIDTGASQMVFSEKLTNQLGLKSIASTVMFGVGGAGKVDSKIYQVNQVQIGDVKIKNLPVGTFNDPLVSQLADGIIGTAMLSDFIVTIDYPGGHMDLNRKNTATGSTIPVWYFSNLLLMPIEINGQHGNFLVDTGAVTTVLSHNIATALGVDENTPGAKIDVGLSGVGGIEGTVLLVPQVTLKTPFQSEYFPQVVSIDLKEVSKMLQTEVSGVIGYDFLVNYKLTIDYNKAEVRLSK